MLTSGLLFQVLLCCGCWQVFGSEWNCPWKFTRHDCPTGKNFCYCPGDTERVSFEIECGKEGFYRCRKPLKFDQLNCQRYDRCQTCKPHAGREDLDVCTSCLEKYKGFHVPRCTEDIIECDTDNGGCEHQCQNTIGSYCCHCKPGYSKNSDKHSCDRLSCGRPEDEEGRTMTSVTIPGADHWEYETYVEYSCTRLHQVIIGETKRKCDLTSEHEPIHDCTSEDREIDVEWHGQVPECVVECNPQEHHEQCGVLGVDPLVCDQLGCCYHDDLGTCHMRPGHHYVEFDGVRPQPIDQVSPIKVQDTSVCKNKCEEDPDCHSFAVVQLETTVNCHLFKLDRQHYIKEGELRMDSNSIYYDPLLFREDFDWKGERAEIQNQLNHGCFDIETVEQYLPLVARTGERLLTSMKCVDTCQALGYHYSGVKVDECRCGKEVPSDVHNYSDQDEDLDENLLLNSTLNMVCLFNCSGDEGQSCGGQSRYSVQMVPQDSRYLGCFDDSIHRIPIRRWHRDANKTVEECIYECARIGHGYAAVQNGGACYCGLFYPTGAGVSQTKCDEPCVADRSYQLCGGLKYNSVYRAPAVVDLSANKVSHFAVNLYHDDKSMTTTDTVLFTLLPQLCNYVTPKLVLSASVPFMAPQEDHFCSSGDCYAPCGSLEIGNQNIGDQEYVTFRQFIVRYSDIKEALKDKNPKQVNIYAQAVYIDTDLVLDYALLIRARQIFIDREKSTYFHSSDNAPTLNMIEDEWQRIQHEGPYPDLLFQRLSYTCLRILVSTNEQRFINIGYSIVNDLIAAPAKDLEQEAMVRSAAALKAKFSGIDFANTHHVPLYNKNHLVSILETYYDQISIYKKDYDRLQDSALLYADFLHIASSLNEIHQSTVVNEALVSLKNVQESYALMTAVQADMEENYNLAAENIEIARENLVAEIQKDYEDEVKRSRLAFFTGIAGIIVGAVKKDFGTIAKSAGSIYASEKQLDTAFNQLAGLVAQINEIVKQSKEIMDGDNDIIKEKEGKLYVDLELMVSMTVNIPQWQNIKYYSDEVIADMTQEAAFAFQAAMSEYCIWGAAFSQAMVDRAETLRQMLEKQAIYDLRKLQEERTQQVLEDAENAVEQRLDVMHVMQEQMLDVCIDLNDVLLQFCQAYFFENLKECREEYRPSFGGSMSSLLLKINAAKRDSLYSADVPSSISRSVVVVNKNDSSACKDPLVCPVTVFDKSRFLVLTIKPQEKYFTDIQKYRVKEIFLEFHGLDRTQNIDKMKFFIQNTGLFYDVRSEVFNFLTRPIHLAFQKEVIPSGHVTIHADYPDDVHQITPFTTWVIKVVDEDGRLDMSDVTEIKFRFDGSGIPIL